MFIRNKSADTQTGIDTGLIGFSSISVVPWYVFQCDDDVWTCLVQWYSDIFEIVLALTGLWWEANTGSNLWWWEWVFESKSWVVLQFKSITAWANISLSSSWTELEISSTNTAPVQHQVDFNDNSTEYVVLGAIATYRSFIIEYTLEWNGMYEVGYMYIIHDWTNVDMDHEYAGNPDVVDDMAYSVDINSWNVRLVLQSINVWGSLKFRYTVKYIDITT